MCSIVIPGAMPAPGYQRRPRPGPTTSTGEPSNAPTWQARNADNWPQRGPSSIASGFSRWEARKRGYCLLTTRLLSADDSMSSESRHDRTTRRMLVSPAVFGLSPERSDIDSLCSASADLLHLRIVFSAGGASGTPLPCHAGSGCVRSCSISGIEKSRCDTSNGSRFISASRPK
jgi:hypothetical protein